MFLFSGQTQAITFEELVRKGSNNIQVIDCRASALYNGWPEDKSGRGGHFPGAVNFYAGWLDLISDSELRHQLALRRINQNKTVYLYGTKKQVEDISHALFRLGFDEVVFIEQSISDYQGKLSALDRFEKLVPARWLNELLLNNEPEYSPSEGYVVIEVDWGQPKLHLISHVPGALYLDTNRLEKEEHNWNRVDPIALKGLLEELGVTSDTSVILYDRNNMAASRAANIFMYAGVKDVRLLDGGWEAWLSAGYPTEALINSTTPTQFDLTIPQHPELIADIPEVKRILADRQGGALVSVRSWPEFIGETSGYSYIKKKGRIKGAKWGHAGRDAYHLEDFHNPDSTMIGADIIIRNWLEWGVQKEQKVSFYCGTGWRASEAFYYAYVMGWPMISVFDGGWFEWSADPENPIDAGVPQPAVSLLTNNEAFPA